MLEISFTRIQVKMILWCVEAGLEQNKKFLRHDDWDHRMTKRERHRSLRTDRIFERVIKLIKAKL